MAALLLGGLLVFALGDSGEGGADSGSPTTDKSTNTIAETEAPAASSAPASSNRSKSLPTRGRIRGSVSLPRGVQAPKDWGLSISPSLYFPPGGAESRRLSFTGDALEFDVQDLPFGGYEVRPVAQGMNSVAVPLELTPETAVVLVNLVLQPAGSLFGSLEYDDGSPVEDIPVRAERLATRADDLEVSRTTTTRLDGSFTFDALPDGEYTLFYGDQFNPILRPEKLSFVAPSLHLPTRKLVGLGEVTIELRDFSGNPIPDVALFGSGKQGGTIDHFTGPDGDCRITGLPAGSYRVRTEHPGFSSRGQLFELEPAQRSVLRITLDE